MTTTSFRRDSRAAIEPGRETRVLRVVLACVAAWFMTSAALAQQPAASARPASITVTLDDNYPPYTFRSDSGKLQGIRKDIWELWSRKTGIPVRFEAKDWSLALAQMAAGEADVIDTIFKTEARTREYDFSGPYANIEVPIYFDQDISGISNAESLRGFTIAVKDADACIDWLKARGVSNFRKFPSYETLIKAAAIKDVRVFCMDAPPANYFLYKQGMESRFRYTAPLYVGHFHWAVKKGNTILRKIVADGFAQISGEERKAIDDRWLGHTLVEQPFARYALYAVLTGAGIAFLLILWNGSLRRRVLARTAALTAALAELNASKRHYEDLVSTTPVGVFETDAKGACVFVNDRWVELTGISKEDALGDGWTLGLHADFREQVHAEWIAAVTHVRPFHLEYCFRHADGKEIWVLGHGSALRNEQGDVSGYIGTITDINERKSAESRIEFLAHHDTLTALPNRMLARDRVEVAMAFAERLKHRMALVFLDLDNFKAVNDSLGHNVGDALLKAVAARLRSGVRETDTISRQGGDEFLIILPDIADADAIAAITSKLLDSMSQPFDVEGHELAISASAGIAVFPDDGTDFDSLLKKADTAMYHAKQAGRSTYRFFSEQMNVDAVEHLRLQTGLRRGLEQREFLLHFQPQIDLAANRPIGAEALIRWNHPELGLIPPARFIPVAEASGMIVAIGDWVLLEACRQAVSWQRAGFPDLTVSVNLSAIQFKRSDLQKTVLNALEESGLEPHCLELELTESIMIADTEIVLDTVRRLKALGVKLSLDDFGTGYSSLSYLKRFPLDKLKIDQSFIRDMTSDADNAAIVRAIIQLARTLSLRTLAEGVEDESTANHLRIHHCDEAQGYYFARPMPANEFLEYLKSKGEGRGTPDFAGYRALPTRGEG